MMTKVKISSVFLGQMDLLVVCVLVQIFAVTFAYRYDPDLAALPFRDFSKEFDIQAPVSWDTYNQQLTGDDLPEGTNPLDNQKRLAGGNSDLFGDVTGEARSRQLQHELRYIVKQLEKFHQPQKQGMANVIDSKQLSGKQQKRQSGSGAQICIWKVCPPSPWRRSGGGY